MPTRSQLRWTKQNGRRSSAPSPATIRFWWSRQTETPQASFGSGLCSMYSRNEAPVYRALKRNQTSTPMAAGRTTSAQSCHSVAQLSRKPCGSAVEPDVTERRFDRSPRIARTISSLPLRSAIRMVAEFMPLVDCSSFLRSEGGMSSTDRYTSVLSPTEMKMVELFKVTRDIQTPRYGTQDEAAWGTLATSGTERSSPACSRVTWIKLSAAFDSALSLR